MSDSDTLVRPSDVSVNLDSPFTLPRQNYVDVLTIDELEQLIQGPLFERPGPEASASDYLLTESDVAVVDFAQLAIEAAWGTVNWGVDTMCMALSLAVAIPFPSRSARSRSLAKRLGNRAMRGAVKR